jgi:ketosteroid isomerase-like protein
MADQRAVEARSTEIAEAIGRRDVEGLRRFLAPGFSHRTTGGATTPADAFLEGVSAIPGTIEFVKLTNLQVEVVGDSALVTGTQHARVVIDGEIVDDRRGFVDYFVRSGDTWLLRAAFEL